MYVMDPCAHLLDRRAVISQQPLQYIMDANHGLRMSPSGNMANTKEFFAVTRYRGTPRPNTELYATGYFKLPGEGELVASTAAAQARFGQPTGGQRSKSAMTERGDILLRQDTTSDVIDTVATPDFMPYPFSSRNVPRYTLPEF